MLDVSIIIGCRNEVDNLKKTVDSIMNSKNRISFEIIVVDDGSTDKSCDFIKENKEFYNNIRIIYSNKRSVSGTRNLGADFAQGEYLFFCDAHIKVSDYWLDDLVGKLEESNAHCISPAIKDMLGKGIAYGATWNERLEYKWILSPKKEICYIPMFCGCTFGIKKDIFKSIGGFDRYFKVYGVEDQEMSLRLWLFGYKIILNPLIEVEHLFKTTHNFEITHENIIYNFLCMIFSHFNENNLIKALSIVKNNNEFSKATSAIMLNEDLIKQRNKYFKNRKYNENDFFEKFNIYF